MPSSKKKKPPLHPWRVWAPKQDNTAQREYEDRRVPYHANPLRRKSPSK